MRFPWFYFLLFCLFISDSVFAQGPSHFYDEVRDEQGQLRPHYRNVWPIYESMNKTQRRRFQSLSRQDFKGDNALSPLPRVLTSDEYAELKRGVEQRGKAIRLFLQDHYSGKKTYLKKIIPEDVIRRVLRRTAEDLYEGQIDPSRIYFPYGPDIIRDGSGQWRVLEDNPGFIGGQGDLVQARESLLRHSPSLETSLTDIDDPADYYRGLTWSYKSVAAHEDGIAVMFQMPPYADNEDKRMMALYKKQGVEVVTAHTKAKIVSTPKGLFLETPSSTNANVLVRKRIGMLILNGEHDWMDANDPVTYRRALILEAKRHLEEKTLPKKARAAIEATLQIDSGDGHPTAEQLERALKESNMSNGVTATRHRRIPDLIKHWREGRVQLNYSPGVDFIGDKEFNLYVEELIRFYLKEEPILKNVETHRFADKQGHLDSTLLKRIMDDKKNWVIKQVDGRGGDGIWVGPKVDAKRWSEAQDAVRAAPDRFLAQRYTPLSMLDDMIVDLRMISFVHPKGVFVSGTPWGRGIPASGDGKVNLSKAGVEVPIVVLQGPNGSCRRALSRLTH